nr:HNH endonuclease signature motif containing protein [uncultured Cupriavidus sp.]
MPSTANPLPKLAELPQFVVGRQYIRNKDITGKFGGSPQGGIAPSLRSDAIFLFSGESGERYGYNDHFDEAGTLLYVGEGRTGDMKMSKGNKAIAEHATTGRALHVFKTTGKGKPCEYAGEFVYDSYFNRRGLDEQKTERELIVFRLVPVHQTVPEELSGGEPVGLPPVEVQAPGDLAKLRKAAIEACKPGAAVPPKESVRTVYQRSALVKRYVLARAAGHCELCGEAAPFKRESDGSPYLEPHHINRVSDGGLDHPAFVGAICPTCHRHIHFGADGDALNMKLRAIVTDKEPVVAAEKFPPNYKK